MKNEHTPVKAVAFIIFAFGFSCLPFFMGNLLETVTRADLQAVVTGLFASVIATATYLIGYLHGHGRGVEYQKLRDEMLNEVKNFTRTGGPKL